MTCSEEVLQRDYEQSESVTVMGSSSRRAGLADCKGTPAESLRGHDLSIGAAYNAEAVVKDHRPASVSRLQALLSTPTTVDTPHLSSGHSASMMEWSHEFIQNENNSGSLPRV